MLRLPRVHVFSSAETDIQIMKMGLKVTVFIVLFVSVSSSPPGKRGRDDDGKGMRKHAQEMKQFMGEKFAELKDTIEAVNTAKLDHITEVVEEIRRNQRYYNLCKEDTCGEHGTCELSEDEQSYVCQCEEGHAGEHCEISGQCNVTRYEIQQLPPMPGREIPNCAEDGSYAGMQYIGSMAYCVTSDNEEIAGYQLHRWEAGDNMNCQCARDEFEHSRSGSDEEKVFNCQADGSYPDQTCESGQCWCLDWQGQQEGEAVPEESKDTLSC